MYIMINNVPVEKVVNQDFICVIREKDGKTVFETVDIPQSVELLSKLSAMVENDNVHLLDMQSQLNIAFPNPSSRVDYNYVSPYEYHDSQDENGEYIRFASYPKLLTYNEYRALLCEKKAQYKQVFEDLNKELRDSDPQEYETGMDSYIKESLFHFDKSQKTCFLKKAKRYIHAYDYYNKLSEVNSLPDVRMYSTDTLGWSNFWFKVTDDISIWLRTNFGYGNASYFGLNIIFKGVTLLPYSAIVKYFYANMRDLLRYTRLYETVHDSWNVAFDCVADVANQAAASATDFLQKWVFNEVKEMVKELHDILKNPGFYVLDKINMSGLNAESGFLQVRNMSEHELQLYGVYPNEMTMVVKAEKVTGALEFLSNLSKLSNLLPELDGFIKEIKRIAVSLIPSLDFDISRSETKIESLKLEKSANESVLSKIMKDLEPHEKEIERLYQGRPEDDKHKFREQFEQAYSQSNEAYRNLKAQKNDYLNKIYSLENEIQERQKFLSTLIECRHRVERAGLAKAR